ncbi:MAG: prolipoprotein diacylglyceryl transferase [Bdellovibrionota bacterium]
MIAYPKISPEIFSIGPITLRWYGMMYVIGFIFGFHILKARIRAGYLRVSMQFADTYITYVVIGMLLGARLVYVFVYNWPHYSTHPGEILAVWSGGLSFHGAALGMMIASWLYSKNYKVKLLAVLDTLAICSPIGLFMGRIGNFINGELYGRVTDVPWAMVFPTDPRGLPRHPSQLYQAFTEGVVLLIILCVSNKRLLEKRKLRNGMLAAIFIGAYGVMRFIVEFVRQPDAQFASDPNALGTVLGPFSMGQVLCFIMIVIATILWTYSQKTQPLVAPKPMKEEVEAPNAIERLMARLTT